MIEILLRSGIQLRKGWRRRIYLSDIVTVQMFAWSLALTLIKMQGAVTREMKKQQHEQIAPLALAPTHNARCCTFRLVVSRRSAEYPTD